MKREYDFSGAERGKFYQVGESFHLPVRLEGAVLGYLLDKARHLGVEVDRVINEVLREQAEADGTEIKH